MLVGPSKRALKASKTRARILRAAGELFVREGHGATSLHDVATRAGVAVQTIYIVFGNKRTLLKELVDVTITGDDEPVATMDRPWFKEALAAPTAAAHLQALVLMGKPGARADVPPEQAADVLYGLLSPELYLLLTGARGWPHERFEEWAYDTLAAQLLDR